MTVPLLKLADTLPPSGAWFRAKVAALGQALRRIPANRQPEDLADVDTPPRPHTPGPSSPRPDTPA